MNKPGPGVEHPATTPNTGPYVHFEPAEDEIVPGRPWGVPRMSALAAGADDALHVVEPGGGRAVGGNRDNAHPGSLSRRWRVVVIAVLAVPVVAAVGGAAVFMWAARMREVGPDADAMAEDPVLHIDVAGGAPDEIIARTGSEGGLMPAMANRTSEAFRHWTLDSGDWQATLLAAVDDIDAQGVRWLSVSCSPSDVRFQALEEVAIDGEVVTATVSVGVSGIEGRDPRPRLLVRLASDGYAPSSAPPPDDPEMLHGCPPAVAEAFTALRARPRPARPDMALGALRGLGVSRW